MDNHDAVAHHAVLIGIDAYPTRPLKGCVQDVRAIEECLKHQLKLVNIQTFTASKNTNSERVTLLEEGPDQWPTHQNVISALTTVKEQANPKDFVYIHYSGHGTRMQPCFDISNLYTGDLALVLIQGPNSREEFLHGPKLAGLVKGMVDKGLVVTLVLDCCFSASVYRNIDSENARYLSYNWPDSRQASDLENSLASLAARSTKRDASMRDNWLLNPDQYTILAACGPHETAKERLETSQWSGALSSRLVKALSSSSNGLRRSHGDIYRHLRTSFRESGVAQNPVLYGNQNQGFFGLVDPDHQLRAIGIAKHEGKVRLLAGKAHGFRDGDKFDILSQSTSNLGSKERLIAKITRTGPLTSELELPNSLDSLAGWIAKPLDGSYPQDFRIQLAPNLPHKDEWLTVLKERSLEAHINVEQAFDLKVVLGSSGEYEILNEHSQKVINLPTLPQSQTNAKRICNIIEHLAQFTMVKNLSNKLATNNFRNSFEVRMSADKKEPYSPGEQIEIQHESIVRLQITRKKEDTGLYIFVYDLGPFWKVERMHGATYVDMPPRKKLLANGGYARDIEMCEWKIKMMVPDVLREHGSCEDIIKIIVTSKPTTFDLLELPDIEKLSSASTKLRITHFEDVLEDWAAFNFPIRTSC